MGSTETGKTGRESAAAVNTAAGSTETGSIEPGVAERPGPQTAAGRAYAALRDEILEQRLAQGEMLSEAALADRFDMSRTPVRAALVRLQEEGWITIYPKRGALVRGLDERELAELADVRLVLESAGVQRAEPARREELVGRLAELIEEQRLAFAGRDLKRFIDLTIAFHRSFVEVSGNRVLIGLGDRLADRQRYLLFSQGERLLQRCEYILDEHRRLVDALSRDDPEAFSETLRRHVGDVHAECLAPLSPLP